MKNPMHRSNNVVLAFTLDKELVEQLDRAAADDGRSRSSYVRWVVTQALRANATSSAPPFSNKWCEEWERRHMNGPDRADS